MSYEGILEGIKSGKFKFIYTAKKTEQKVLNLIEKKKIKIYEDDLNAISDDSFRKVR